MAYTGKVAMGLSKIEVGTPVSGGEATSYATLGYTDPGSCTLEPEDAEETEVEAEEVDDPVYVISKPGKKRINFNVVNPEGQTLEDMIGGEWDSTTNTWDAPAAEIEKELSVKITTKTGFVFIFPRVKLSSKHEGTFGKNEPIKLVCKGTVMVPADGTTSKMKVKYPTS